MCAKQFALFVHFVRAKFFFRGKFRHFGKNDRQMGHFSDFFARPTCKLTLCSRFFSLKSEFLNFFEKFQKSVIFHTSLVVQKGHFWPKINFI